MTGIALRGFMSFSAHTLFLVICFIIAFLTVHILQSEKVKVYGKLAILNKSILQFVNLLFRNLMENNT